MRVLLVDGDLGASRALFADLKSEGFHVELSETGEDALSLLRHYEFDVVLASLSLPDMEGAALIARMRNAKHDTAVLALTRGASTEIRLRALTAGADDVVHRQTELLELVARMKAIVRRSRGYSQSSLRIGAISLNADMGTVCANDIPVALTQKEFALLKTLMLRRNMVLTKEALMNAIYGGMDEPASKIIDVFICKIRNKFAKIGFHDVIGTVWGRGYIVNDKAGHRETMPLPHIRQPAKRSRRSAYA